MYKALIIDDEEPAQIAISKQGHWHHYSIELPYTASDGEDGLQLMRETHPNIVFVDMNMPIMNGCEFLEIAKNEFPDCKCIVISGYDKFAYAQQAIRCGAIDYLLKPIDEKLLNCAIEKALKAINPDNDCSNTNAIAEITDSDDVIQIIKDYVDKHYCEDIKLSDFECKYNYSGAYLTSLFRSAYGYSLYEYILKLKMERAQVLLKNPNIKIQEISERLSYSDNHYFSKAFKNYFNMSPSQYRDYILMSHDNDDL